MENLELKQNLLDSLQDSISLMNLIISDTEGDRRYKVTYRKRLQQTKLELEYIYRDLKATLLHPHQKDLFGTSLREVVREEISKGYRIVRTGFDPETNRISSIVVKTPMAALLSQLNSTIDEAKKVIKAYPKQAKDLRLILSDFKTLHEHLVDFAEKHKMQ